METPTSSAALRFSEVRKRFGATRALDGLNLEVPRGSFFGLIGPNGAGKTTAFSLACGFLQADGGELEILGERGFDIARLKGRLGALPQDATLGRETRCQEHLRHFARLQGLSPQQAQQQADQRLDEVGLADRATHRVKTLSHGMLRRLAVAQALLGEPELVLLDEPTSGLDPRHAHEVRELLKQVRTAGRTVVVSSHNLHELESLCDQVALVDRGVVVTAGPMDVVTGRGQEITIAIGAGSDGQTLLEAVQKAVGEGEVKWEPQPRRFQIVVRANGERTAEDVIGSVLRVLLDAGARISEVRRGSSLEQKFLQIK
jgi:ABC-2 type transport system ATP-binding protein